MFYSKGGPWPPFFFLVLLLQIPCMSPILLSTAYLPPISWMASAIQSEQINIEIQETYPKQTYRNRCNIATASGVLGLTVPVKKTDGNHTKTANILIDYSTNWQQLHWRSIVTAYNKSPYFLYYRDLLEPVFAKKHQSLIDLNHELISLLLKIIDYNPEKLRYTQEYFHQVEMVDFRNMFHPKLKRTDYNPAEMPRYIQVFEEKLGFIPDLSMIDLLFNVGPEAADYLRKIKIVSLTGG